MSPLRRTGPLSRFTALWLALAGPVLSCTSDKLGTALPETPVPTRTPDGAAEALSSGATVRLLLLLDPARVAPTPRRDRVLTPGQHGQRVRQFAEAKKALFAGAPAGLRVKEDYDQLPVVLVDLSTRAAWDYLVSDARVLRLTEDAANDLALESSLPFIRQPEAAAEGKDGTGVSVAVLDTGGDYTLPALGACTAPGVPAATCRVPFARDFAPEDNQLDDSGRHGTNVSAIVAGVAPGASILPLDVFHGASAWNSTLTSAINWVIASKDAYNIAAINMSLGSQVGYTVPCSTTAVALAIDEARRAGILSAVATGNSSYTNAIAHPACAPAAVSVGAVHDGSDWYGEPDEVTYFSNSASFMSLLAPGYDITAGGITMSGTSQATPHVAGALAVLRAGFPGETVEQTVARMLDTGVPVTDARNGITRPRLDLAAASAGTVLKVTPVTLDILEDAYPFDLSITTSPDCSWTVTTDNPDMVALLTSPTGTGPGVVKVQVSASTVDERTGRITVTGTNAAPRTVVVTQQVDTTPPTGSVLVNAGAAWTTGTSVTLSLAGSDANGVTSMCISGAEGCSAFEPFAATKAWTLAASEGPHAVRAWLKDSRGNVSAALSDDISLDSVAPADGTLGTTSGNREVKLRWSAAADATSGVASYRLVSSIGTPPASCAEGTVLYEGPAQAWSHGGLVQRTTYGYRLCAVDRAGNTSTGVTATAESLPDAEAPTGTLAINGGSAFTSSTTVSLALEVQDASAVSSMCLTSGASCPAADWRPYSASLPAFELAPTQGPQRVNAWLRDEWGNVTASPLSDTITLDTTRPTGGTLSATSGSRTSALRWTVATDTLSGVGAYRLVFSPGAPPATCSEGTLLFEGVGQAWNHTGLANGTRYGYRLCAVDRAGNLGRGTTATTEPMPETAPPTGTLVVNGGATFTSSATVSLALSATDASTITGMCLSNSSACPRSAWRPFSATVSPFTLTRAQGLRRVYAWLRDEWGNTTAAPLTATITLDTAAPTGASLSAMHGNQLNTLRWTAATDGTSGVAGYRLVFSPGAPPTSCSAGTLLYEGTALAYTHAGLSNAAMYGYRLCAVDRAGNSSSGTTATAKPLPEMAPPTGTVAINGGAASTPSASVSLSLTAADASAISSMCVSNTSSCAPSAWRPFSPTVAWALTTSQGLKRVSVWLRDEWGNTTATPLTATTMLDSVAPTGGALTARPGAGQVSLSWTAAVDSGVGVQQYKLVHAVGNVAPPAGCSGGTLLYAGSNSTFVATGLAAGTTHAFRLCAVDRLGNTGMGSAAAAKALP